jgi:hypothetical protein
MLDGQLEELRAESESAAKVFKNRMMEMNSTREARVEANLKVISEVESQIGSAIKAGEKKL